MRRIAAALMLLFALTAPSYTTFDMSAKGLSLPLHPSAKAQGAVPAGDQRDLIKLSVDAGEAPRRILHVQLSIPVAPGPLRLFYPKWLPGEHGPTGPVVNLVDLKLMAAGREIEWRRDEADMYTFHCVVPAGANTLEVSFNFVSPSVNADRIANGFSANSTDKLVALNWNTVLLYPSGTKPDELMIATRLRLPAGWKYGTALPVASSSALTIEFQPVSLSTLIDSPLIAGAHFRSFDLTPGAAISHQLDVVADSSEALDASPATLGQYKRLIAEANSLFGARHYRRYHFLLVLSDALKEYGLEHHESSDNRVPERMFLDESILAQEADLLPHEFTHSWNGKYRRPAGLVTTDFQQPMKTDLLWVYEGLTTYLGYVLATRSGLMTPELCRELIARYAAAMESRSGRGWRPLVDTATATQLLESATDEWTSRRRSLDYYLEGVLLWLEVDAVIRQQTGGRRSLDDFCRAFFGGADGEPVVKPYTFDDVVSALNSVAPYRWQSFLSERVNSTSTRAPVGGILASGWQLVYTETPNESLGPTFTFSIGLSVGEDGAIKDVLGGKAADVAGLGPGMKIIAVDERSYTPARLHAALKRAQGASRPIELLVLNGDYYKKYGLDYHDGDRYPHLLRDTARRDLLGPILNSITSSGVTRKSINEESSATATLGRHRLRIDH